MSESGCPLQSKASVAALWESWREMERVGELADEGAPVTSAFCLCGSMGGLPLLYFGDITVETPLQLLSPEHRQKQLH